MRGKRCHKYSLQRVFLIATAWPRPAPPSESLTDPGDDVAKAIDRIPTQVGCRKQVMPPNSLHAAGYLRAEPRVEQHRHRSHSNNHPDKIAGRKQSALVTQESARRPKSPTMLTAFTVPDHDTQIVKINVVDTQTASPQQKRRPLPYMS